MTHPAEMATSKTARAIRTADYVRQRIHPGLRDLNYLHLTDLVQLMQRIAAETQGEVFDYGCGGAPYRSLFTQCKRYVAADIEPGDSVDLVLQPDGTTGEPDETYDLILSTQVLEHIGQPEVYLRECHRILRSRGQLLLTTHGMFEEHACPYDFHRWTARGLEELASKNGFTVIESGKLTTELRAFVQVMNQMILHLRCPERPVLHRLLAIVRKAYCLWGVPFLNWSAKMFHHQAIVPSRDSDSLYVGVYVRAVKN